MSLDHIVLLLQTVRHQAGLLLAVPGQGSSEGSVRKYELRRGGSAETLWSRALEPCQGQPVLPGQLRDSQAAVLLEDISEVLEVSLEQSSQLG